MTFDKILDGLTFNLLSADIAKKEMTTKENMKRINYFINIDKIKKDPLTDAELLELNSIVGILQILYNAEIQSPITDSQYDLLQEILVYSGYHYLTGSVEITDAKKESHAFKNLRGTLSKVYYLSDSEKQINKSRKRLSDWIKRIDAKYKSVTNESIDWGNVKVLLQPKFDGVSGILEVNNEIKWLTRGDTSTNRASNISFIMNYFNSQYATGSGKYGTKFEIMCSENHLDDINRLEKLYNNSRQVVISFTNSVNDSKDEIKWKSKYLTPIPLRIINEGDEIPQIHPELIEKYPTIVCKLSDIDTMKEFAKRNKFITIGDNVFRTDGAVLTIIDQNICKILGREHDINNFEVAYKFTEEIGISRAVGYKFDVSEFGFITPVLLVDPIKLKGNTISQISISNNLRFKELDVAYGDEIEVHYDIIPYATIGPMCKRSPTKKKIEFPTTCPRCSSELDLSRDQVRCQNQNCPSRIVGRIMNFCNSVGIKNIGIKTLDLLYKNGFLDKGIRSLYKLKKHSLELDDLEGFGPGKIKNILFEIEAKRRLPDYMLFGSLSIDSASVRTFQLIFESIPYHEFIELLNDDTKYDQLAERLVAINGIGDITANMIIKYFKNESNMKYVRKLLDDLQIYASFGKSSNIKGVISFTGFRPDDEMKNILTSKGYRLSDSLTNASTYLVTIPDYESSKIEKARKNGIPIIMKDKIDLIK